MSNAVVVAKLGAPYGLRGWIKVNSFTDPVNNILGFEEFLIKDTDGEWVELPLEAIKPHGKTFVAKFAPLEDRDDAAYFTNKEIAVERDNLPDIEDSSQHYWNDLIGMEVVNQDDVALGKITSMLATGANDVLITEDKEQRHLIPYVFGDFVTNVDLAAKKMAVNWDLES